MTSRFLTLFWRQVARQIWRHPLLTGLNVLSIALGITVFLAIQIANRGALESFQSAADMTTGRAHLEIRGVLDDELLPAVTRTAGVRMATPLVEGIVTLPGEPGEYLRLVGIDPLSSSDFFNFQLKENDSGSLDLEKWLGESDAIAVQADLGRQTPFEVLAGTSLRRLTPAYVLQPDDKLVQADTRLAAMDIGWAQELLGMVGKLTSIQIILDRPEDVDAVAGELRRLVPADVTVAPPATRSEEMQTMLGAFQLNLTALSLVSVVVGMFLIANSVSATVTRRRTEIAILRAAGTSRIEIRALFLGETLLAAIAGVFLALVLAPLLASAISNPISQTVSSLYEVVRISHVTLGPDLIFQAFTVGLMSAVIAAWYPASNAARTKPARILHPGAGLESVKSLKTYKLVLAFLALIAATLMSYAALHGGSKFLGFGAAAAVLADFSLMAPWVAAAVAMSARRSSVLIRLAADHLVRSLDRNALTIAALAAAVAMTISVTVMIHSFRGSVDRWIGHTLTADLYISPAANEISGPQYFLPQAARTWAAEQPEVAETATFREVPVRVRGEMTSLAVVEGAARGQLDFVDGPGAEETFESGEAVAVSESFATRFGVKRGDELFLPTPQGEQAFRISGIYKDFARDSGTVMMQRSLYSRYWADEDIHSLSLKLRDPAASTNVVAAFREKFGGDGQFTIYENASLRDRIFAIFDQTFAITSVLRSIAVLVAFAGVFFSLTVLVLEREREIGVLRATGASRAQVLGIFLGEAALIGIAATISGLASGGVLALVLTGVINKAFFGWSIVLSYPVAPLASTPLWLIPAALVAALIPAWRAANVAPARAVRFE